MNFPHIPGLDHGATVAQLKSMLAWSMTGASRPLFVLRVYLHVRRTSHTDQVTSRTSVCSWTPENLRHLITVTDSLECKFHHHNVLYYTSSGTIANTGVGDTALQDKDCVMAIVGTSFFASVAFMYTASI